MLLFRRSEAPGLARGGAHSWEVCVPGGGSSGELGWPGAHVVAQEDVWLKKKNLVLCISHFGFLRLRLKVVSAIFSLRVRRVVPASVFRE